MPAGVAGQDTVPDGGDWQVYGRGRPGRPAEPPAPQPVGWAQGGTGTQEAPGWPPAYRDQAADPGTGLQALGNPQAYPPEVYGRPVADPAAGLRALGRPQPYDQLWAGERTVADPVGGVRTPGHDDLWAGPTAQQGSGRVQPAERRTEQAPPAKGGRGRRRVLIGGAVALVLLLLAGVGQWLRPLPAPELDLTIASQYTFAGTAPSLPMPTKGQAVIAVAGLGTMASSGAPTPTPTASVAKVMTAYLFLKDHPLAAGASGPTYTISAAEAAKLQWRIGRGESHVNVTAGEPFTEQEALQALIIVSANNVAHEMARWDAGNEAAFVQKMNTTAQQLGMTGTTYTDPSGYDSTTVSTAADQVKLLRAVMQFPAFAQVAAMRSYQKLGSPDPTEPSTNALLGVDGVVAGKTGYTDAAGGNFVFAARKSVRGVSVLIVGAVMAQTGVTSSKPTVQATRPLIAAAEAALTSKALAARGAVVGKVDDRLGTTSPVVASSGVTVVGWPGLTVRLGVTGTGTLPHTALAGQRLGEISLGDGTGAPAVPMIANTGIGGPSIAGRLLRLG